MEEEDMEIFPTPIEDEEEEEEEGGREEETVLQFLDSLDDYLVLFDTLSSTLRQGWLELASARYSMGSSRITGALLDLKVQSAPTSFQITELADGSPLASQPHFTLSKWTTLREDKCTSEVEGGELQTNSEQLRHRVPSHFPEKGQENNSSTKDSPVTVDSNVQRERSKSLSVFGTLVSPKLRAAQVSFESVLERIVEIANKRSSMLSAFSSLQQQKQISN